MMKLKPQEESYFFYFEIWPRHMKTGKSIVSFHLTNWYFYNASKFCTKYLVNMFSIANELDQ